jgi:hypothetical protein
MDRFSLGILVEMKNKELLIEVSTTSPGSPFIKDLRGIYGPPTPLNIGVINLSKDEENVRMYKNKYPGNYILEEYLDPKLIRVLYRLKFETPADKTIFLLRYT